MEKYLQEFFGNLTPSELDELAPAGFDAAAPRGALKRIEKSAIEKAGVRPAKRKRYFKPLMIAAAAVVASAATLFTVNASTDGNLVKFLFKGDEYEGDTYDYVDHDGYRHIGFEVKVPVFEDNYAIIYDVDAPQGENVRVITEESDPELMAKIKAYAAARFNDFVDYRDFGIVLKDSELCVYSVGYMDEERAHNQNGSFGGEFMRTGAAAGKPSGINNGETDGTFYDWDFENEQYFEMKTIRKSIYYYVGEDYVKESVREIEGVYRDYVDHDGYRNVSFKATIPFSAEYYVVIFDVDATTTEEAVRVITSYSDPDFIDKLRQYRAAEKERSEKSKELWDRIYAWKGRNMQDDDVDERDRVRQEALEAGVFTPDELGKYPEPEDFGIVLKDNELLCYHVNFYDDDGGYRGGGGDGYRGGEFMFMGEAEGHPSGCGPRNHEQDEDDGVIDYENGTLTRTYSFFYYVGKD